MSAPRPLTGSICRATRANAAPRLVLLVEDLTHEVFPSLWRVRLLTNEVEMATGAETFLPAEATGRSYDLLVHEFHGYMLAADLSAALTSVDPRNDLLVRRAPPVWKRADPRWRWKIRELEAMQALQPALSVILGEQPG